MPYIRGDFVLYPLNLHSNEIISFDLSINLPITQLIMYEMQYRPVVWIQLDAFFVGQRSGNRFIPVVRINKIAFIIISYLPGRYHALRLLYVDL